VTTASDVFAFGCVMWELLTCGRAPYQLAEEDWCRAWTEVSGACMHAYIYACIHTYMHAYIHICMHGQHGLR